MNNLVPDQITQYNRQEESNYYMDIRKRPLKRSFLKYSYTN